MQYVCKVLMMVFKMVRYIYNEVVRGICGCIQIFFHSCWIDSIDECNIVTMKHFDFKGT